MSTLPITKYVQDATLLALTDLFNATYATLAAGYGVPALAINWTLGGPQYFPADLLPEDVEESTPCKYPLVFMHGSMSHNTHNTFGTQFSGPVVIRLTFWFSAKAQNLMKAALFLENVVNCAEQTLNDLFTDGNWPTGYGGSGAVCLPPKCQRARVEQAGEMWRQAYSAEFLFTLTT